MKKIISILLVTMFLIGCGNTIDINGSSNNNTSAPVDTAKQLTMLTGQIYYSANEILYSVEKEAYAGYSYSLLKFSVYVINSKHAYKVTPDWEGNWYLDNMEAGTYQVIIKSKEYFQDDKGTFTYMIIQNVEVKGNTITAMGVLNPIRMYMDQEETQNAIQDLHTVSPSDIPPQNDNTKTHTTADLN